jgi:hypothetical protein
MRMRFFVCFFQQQKIPLASWGSLIHLIVYFYNIYIIIYFIIVLLL